jgi:enterochelin esterase-like enzyme
MFTFHLKKLNLKVKSHSFFSDSLKNTINLDVYLPPSFGENTHQRPFLMLNDAQDMQAVHLENTLSSLYKHLKIKSIIVIAIYPNDRMQEYGTAAMPDYANRGSEAGNYSKFIVEELIPFLEKHYRIDIKSPYNAFAGFSLGGLSALDIVWNHSNIFKKVGVFSGALWWRSKPFKEEAPDDDRIIHDGFAESKKRKGLRFWLQTGTNDETTDRNNNGVIDAIDDTLDLIKILKNLGYRSKDIKYVEVEGGEHNPDTWAKVLPDFLVWSFGLKWYQRFF